MTDDLRQLDGVEETLLELDTAETAGLFRRTRIDAGRLVARSAPVGRGRSVRLALRVIPAAAAVVIAVGAGMWMFRAEPDSIRGRDAATTSVAAASDPCDISFPLCLKGPGEGVLGKCLPHDYDSDGDVDLADFRSYQLACVSPKLTH
jgi:hypothetical protein